MVKEPSTSYLFPAKSSSKNPVTSFVLIKKRVFASTLAFYSTHSHLIQPSSSLGRKISASLALERKMLTIVNVFAVFPCP
jgi:hypothetical protein